MNRGAWDPSISGLRQFSSSNKRGLTCRDGGRSDVPEGVDGLVNGRIDNPRGRNSFHGASTFDIVGYRPRSFAVVRKPVGNMWVVTHCLSTEPLLSLAPTIAPFWWTCITYVCCFSLTRCICIEITCFLVYLFVCARCCIS